MCPISQSDGHDGPRLIDEFVPSIATVVEDIVVGEEHAVGEPVVADELPDVLDRVEFWALRRQRHERDVGRYGELVRQVPSRLVDEECGVTARRDGGGDLGQVQAFAEAAGLQALAGANETAIGNLPRAADLNTAGLDISPAVLDELLSVKQDAWRKEVADDFAGYALRELRGDDMRETRLRIARFSV